MVQAKRPTKLIASIDPTTGELLQTFAPLDPQALEAKLALAEQTFSAYRATSFSQRSTWLKAAASILRENQERFALLMTTEMGKTLVSARAEVEKCAGGCDHYADHGESYLADQIVGTDASRSFVRYQPLGPILAVMPWNFPFWQVFRFAAPALMAGNVCLLKHASNVPQCALAIEGIFKEAGLPDGAFQTLLIVGADTGNVVADPRVKAVTLTGSEPAGRSVAAIAGQHLKKTVLELGGSDPFIVLPSADIEVAAATAVKARMLNSGQTCIAAKRYIVVESIADQFEALLIQGYKALHVGDPRDPQTDVGPLATPEIQRGLDEQVRETIRLGAKVLVGGQPLEGNFYAPTLLTDIPPTSPAYADELFGPVGSLFRVPDIDAAIRLANDTPFGLGASAWSEDPEEIEQLINGIEAGAVFINGLVKSDPRLPFGGIKNSGYGRELSREGMLEFVNLKSVWQR